jgi:hypothetical protein
VAGASPLLQLRKIRDEIRRLDANREDLVEGRDHLIREAAEQDVPERQIAQAAGVSHGRVNQIVHRR